MDFFFKLSKVQKRKERERARVGAMRGESNVSFTSSFTKKI